MHKTETNCLGVCIANRWSLFGAMYKNIRRTKEEKIKQWAWQAT